MNVVKEQGGNRGKTQNYMLKADPTLLRSCWEGGGGAQGRWRRGSKVRDRRGDTTQKEKNDLRKLQT